MIRFIGRRLLTSVITIIGVLVIVFFLARLTGSPASLYLPEGASQEAFDEFNRQQGLDQPLAVQFLRFLVDVAHLDFGESIWQQRPALVAALDAMPPTLYLAGIAITIALVVAVVLGSLAAQYQFGWIDRMVTLWSLTVSSIPDFWFALVCVLFFAVNLGWLPTSGYETPLAWILPVATLILSPLGVLTQVVRGAMIDALASGYVQNAKARGFSSPRLLFRHALRNAALPVISVAGDKAAGMVNGAIIVGAVFAFPGIGTVIIGAVLNRDFPLLQASLFVVGIAVVILTIIVDLTYALVDARVGVS